ncbi:MAG: hypothetical protein JST55_05190 [Bacteroidetes bacterium]|nr:hypothetical protein [Bacteroidota bacterium]
MRKIYLLLTAVIVLISINASKTFAQIKTDKPIKFFTFRWSTDIPTIELSYGLSDIKISGYNTDFVKPGMIELKLGYASEYDSPYSTKVIDYDNDYIFLSKSTTDISSKGSPGINSDMWRFGFGNKEGMGLRLGKYSVMPYTSNSFAWSKFTFDRVAAAGAGDYSKFDDFSDAFRFGTATEAGINFQVTKGLSLNPKYEISDIFSRHLFGQQFVSSLIELGGAHILDNFITKIMRDTPIAGTIVNFVLRNAYEYGIYELRRDHANWPFSGEAPLRISSFKMGMSLTF